MTADPLVEAIVRLLTRHHNGCDHPVQPAPWMRNAATEIADAVRGDGLPMSTLCTNCHAPELEDITEALDRRNQELP